MSDGSVTIEVTLTKEQLEKGLKSINKDLNNLSNNKVSSALKTVGTTIANIGNSIYSAGKKITLATAGIVAGLGTAVSRFDTLKNYPKVLSNLGFSAEDAKESIDELSKGIDGLPTALDDAASGVQRLVAKNNDVKKSTKYFLAMNDAIVAGNAPAEQQASAIEQLTQAYSKGKFDMMEWRTLMMAMPGQMKQIANAMGYIDTDQLYNALQKGTISMDNFMDAIVELDQNGGKGIKSFQEQARNSTDSIGTAITNLGNRIKKGFATILQGLDEMASNTRFGSLAGMINEFSTSIKNFLDKIGESVKNNQSLKDFFEKISNTLIKFKDTIDNLSPEQVDKIVSALVNLAKLGPILLVAGKGLSIIGGLISKLGTAISVASKLKTAFTTGGIGAKALSAAFTALTGPVGIVIAAIIAFIAFLVVLYNKSENFRNGVNKAFEQIKNALISAWNTIKPSLEQLWNAIQQLMVALQPLVEFIGGVLAARIKYIVGLISFVIKILAELTSALISALSNYIAKMASFYSYVINVITNVINWFKKLRDNPKQALNDLANYVVNVFKQLPQKMLSIGQNIIQGLWNGIANSGNWIKNKVSNFANGILNSMKSALGIHSPSTLFRDQVGKNIALGVGEGFEDNISKVYRQMKSAVDFETQKLSTNLSATAMMSKVITANINVNGNVDMDGTKVGRLVAPSISRTLRTAGA